MLEPTIIGIAINAYLGGTLLSGWERHPLGLRLAAARSEHCIGAELPPGMYLVPSFPDACQLRLLQAHAQPLKVDADTQHHARAGSSCICTM